jgi:hypothetical protein
MGFGYPVVFLWLFVHCVSDESNVWIYLGTTAFNIDHRSLIVREK